MFLIKNICYFVSGGKKMKYLCTSLLVTFIMSQTFAQNFVPVSNFSLEKYLGTWYEIARMPVSFEKGLSRVTATYSLRDDGKVSVVNRGVKENGKESTAHGKAKFGGAKVTGYLRVSFFWSFYADYIITDLDPDYQYAMVSGGSLKYLWILCRKPELDSAVLNRLVNNAKNLGYATDKLIFTPQQ
jgi:apolipoprotein D and lipocalin family protein